MTPLLTGPQVPAEWPRGRPARVAFIGEAPSDEEEMKLRPLVGPAGRIYDALLRTAGISRAEVYTGNVFDRKLPDNKVDALCTNAAEARAQGWLGKARPPIGDAGYLLPQYHHHLDRLAEEMRAVKPNVVVPMGGTALWAFTGSAAIGAARGALDTARFTLPGVKLLPTYHPAFVRRQWRFFPVVVGDMQKADREGAFPELRLPRRDLLLAPTLEDVKKFVRETLRNPPPVLSTDIETGWHQITCIGFAPSASRAICIPFVDFRRPNRSYWPTAQIEVQVWLLVKELLESPILKLGQNFTYDVFWLLERMGIRPMMYRHDTRLLHHAIYPELPKDLGFLGARYSLLGPWKTMGEHHRTTKRDD